MTWYIDANAKVHATVYDGQSETWRVEEVTVADALEAYSDEGCPAPADVEEVRHGEIIKSGRRYPYCSECKCNVSDGFYRCPWCGAKFDGKDIKNEGEN